jgi:hypothetical protein
MRGNAYQAGAISTLQQYVPPSWLGEDQLLKMDYYQIIDNARTKNYDGYSEVHHITPRALGGSDDQDNLIRLSFREHFLCHWLLIKFVRDPKDKVNMIFALSCMTGINEVLTGKKIVASWQFEVAKRAAKDNTSGENHPMYGKKHKKETIEKMKENNGLRGKRRYENPETGEKKYFSEEEMPDGFILHVYNDEIRKSIGDESRNKKWYHDPSTKQAGRFGKSDIIPDGWIKGRGRAVNEGFQYVKDNMINVIDLSAKKSTTIMKEDFNPKTHIDYQGKNTENSIVYIFDGYIYTKKPLIAEAFRKKYGYFDNVFLTKEWKCAPNKVNPHKKTKIFKDKYKDFTLADFGVIIIKLEDFDTALLKTHKIRSDVYDRLQSSKR